MARATYTDWLKTGLELLAESGPEAIRIDRLCSRMGLTKGSFYHHFDGVGEYTDELTGHWVKEYVSTTLEKGDRLFPESKKGLKLERAFRAWAEFSQECRRHIDQADRLRLDFLKKKHADQAPGEAFIKAYKLYTRAIGELFLREKLTFEEQDALERGRD
jgi:AcrR family transcriptional regulator